MKCTSCGAEIRDESPAFCPRCGAAVGSAETEATTELRAEQLEEAQRPPSGSPDDSAPEGSTERLRTVDTSDGAEPASTDDPSSHRPGANLFAELLSSIGGVLRRQGTGDLIVAALFGFLVAVLIGGVLVGAARLQYPFLGENASSWSVLSAVVIAGVGLLGGPIHLGDVSVSALPLGAIALVGLAVIWATKRVVDRGPAVSVADSGKDGMKIAIPFALMFWLAALIFRIGEEPTRISSDAGAALLLGLLWGTLFGGIGGLLAAKPFKAHRADARRSLTERGHVFLVGVSAGLVMLAVAAGSLVVAGIAWIIVGLLADGSAGLTAGELGAGVIYLIAFGPNVLVAIATVAHGGPVDVGAQITISGKQIGNLDTVSLSGWGNGSPPWFAFVLLAVPAVAALLGGFYARRSANREDSEIHILGLAALVYGGVLGLAASLSEARLGAGLVRDRGFGLVSPDPLWTALLAASWALVLGYVGWRLAEVQSEPMSRNRPARRDASGPEDRDPADGGDG